MRGRPAKGIRRSNIIPHWIRGLVVGVAAAAVLHFAERDLGGFPRAALVLLLYLLVLAAAADVVWHVWTCRKPAAVAMLSGGGETVPCYAARLRTSVSGTAVALGLAATALHGSAAMSVLRAWVQLHRWAPAQIALKIAPSTVAEDQPFHLTVMVDNSVASRYRCEWQGPVAEWSPQTSCDVQQRAPMHFVDPDWPTRRIAVVARVFDGDRLLGTTGDETITISYAPVVGITVDRPRIVRGQKAEFNVRVDGHGPGRDDRCRWTVGGEFATTGRCTFSYSGKELTSSAGSIVKIAVEVENTSNHSMGAAEAILTVDQPARYVVYVVEASRRMAQQTPAGVLLDDVKTDLVEGIATADPGMEYVGIATFGGDGSHPACFQNVQVPYPVQSLNPAEVKSVLYLLQPGGADAPLASALLKGLGLLRAHTQRAAPHVTFALVSVAAGLDTCTAGRPEDALKALHAVMDSVREISAPLRGRLLTLTIGIGMTQQARQEWAVLAKVAPIDTPYVIVPAPDIVTLNQALKASSQLGSRDYDARLAGCGDLARILRVRSLDAGAGQVERYCRVLSAP